MLQVGGKQIAQITCGSTPIKEVYVGSNLIWGGKKHSVETTRSGARAIPVPEWAEKISYRIIGGGGGGSVGDGSGMRTMQGGRAGAVVTGTIVIPKTVTVVQTTAGSGGTGGTGSMNDGGPGGASKLVVGEHTMTADGGAGGRGPGSSRGEWPQWTGSWLPSELVNVSGTTWSPVPGAGGDAGKSGFFNNFTNGNAGNPGGVVLVFTKGY